MKIPACISLMMMLCFSNCNNKEIPGTPEEGDFTNALTPQEIADARLTPEMLWKFGRVSEIALLSYSII